jgi:hypothetical protein
MASKGRAASLYYDYYSHAREWGVSTRKVREWADEALPAVRTAGPLAAKGVARGKREKRKT